MTTEADTCRKYVVPMLQPFYICENFPADYDASRVRQRLLRGMAYGNLGHAPI
jgi:hypothetical protein